jgi:hypothetical protein
VNDKYLAETHETPRDRRRSCTKDSFVENKEKVVMKADRLHSFRVMNCNDEEDEHEILYSTRAVVE